MSKYDWLRRSDAKVVVAHHRDMSRLFPGVEYVDAFGNEMSNADWIHNPNLSAVAGWPSRYWSIAGNSVTLMSPSEREAVDDQIKQAALDEEAGRLTRSSELVAAITLLILDEFNARATRFNSLLDAINNASSLAEVKQAVSQIPLQAVYTKDQLIQAIRNRLA